MFTLVTLSSIGLPALNGFVGEFLILLGTFVTHRWWAVASAAGVILAAVYLLWAYQRVFHGEPEGENATIPDMTWRERGVMLPLLVVIEVISYLTRPISLSVRLFANMMAGHTMLKVFGAFVVALGLLGGWAALAFMVAFTGLEILVAFLQAYVFAILTCIYLNDALHMHH